jgi:CBS domain-containing protein
MSGFSTILVPFDYSPPSEAALRLGAEIARAFHGRLVVLHLLAIEVYAYADYPLIAPDGGRLEEARTHLQAHVRSALGDGAPALEVEVSWGSPFIQIVDHAVECRADLIVMGTHGRTGIKHALLGSVAEKTVRLSPCPVLTVHEGTAEAPRGLEHVERRATRPVASPGTVGEAMCRVPVSVRSTDTLEIANAHMLDAASRHLPVVDEGRLVGIITDRDIQPYMGHLGHTRVNAVMTPDPTTVSPQASTADAARRMLERRVRALPVVDGERLIGIVTSTDILEEYVFAARG